MSFQERKGNLFEADVDAIAHGVNCRGVMGAGIAKEFSERYPEMYEYYRDMCRGGHLDPGDGFLWKPPEGPKVYNLASQYHPGPAAKLRWLTEAFCWMLEDAETEKVKSIGLPRIGCGIGGLDWIEVRMIIEPLALESSTEIVVFTNE